ncbi:hypothetical protein MHYP_G00151860 [Metynnis hypsauchen]
MPEKRQKSVLRPGYQRRFPTRPLSPAGFSVHRADRTKDLSGKSKGGSVCFMISNAEDLEYLIISCRPVWLPREISGLTVTAMYIPPQADTNLALGNLFEAVNRQEAACPEATSIVVGDFNQANNISAALPDELNVFYAHFETNHTTHADRVPVPLLHLLGHGPERLQLSTRSGVIPKL